MTKEGSYQGSIKEVSNQQFGVGFKHAGSEKPVTTINRSRCRGKLKNRERVSPRTWGNTTPQQSLSNIQ